MSSIATDPPPSRWGTGCEDFQDCARCGDRFWFTDDPEGTGYCDRCQEFNEEE